MEVKSHLKESRPVVWVPLVCLAIPSLVIGMMMVNGVLDGFFADAITVLPQHNVLADFKAHIYNGAWSMFLHGFISAPFLLLSLGIFTAWICYVKHPDLPATIQSRAKTLALVLYYKYGFDLFNEKIIAPIVRSLGRMFWKYGDVMIIDGLAVNGTAYGIGRIASHMRVIQSGYLYHYIFTMIVALLALLYYMFY